MRDSDELLLERWNRRQDPQAFREIVERHGKAVYAVCLRVLRNHADAADVTQACFLEILRGDTETRPRRLGAWLHGVATKQSLMYLRTEQRRKTRESAYGEEPLAQDKADEDEIFRLLDEAIEELPDELREPVVAHFLYGRSHAAIARATGTPRRTVSYRIQRGLAQMGAFLRSRGVVASTAAVATALASATADAAPVPEAVFEFLAKHALQKAALATGASVGESAGVSIAGALAVKHVLVGVLLIAGLCSGGVWWATRENALVAAAEPQQVAAPPERAATSSGSAADAAAPVSTVQSNGAEVSNSAPQNATVVSGTARFEDSGEPASGVLVRVYNEKTDGINENTDGITEAVTDAEGRYALHHIDPPEDGVDLLFMLDARKLGWHAVLAVPAFRLYPGQQHADIDITLTRNQGSISGTVRAKDIQWHKENARRFLATERETPPGDFQLLFTEQSPPAADIAVILEGQGFPRFVRTDEHGRFQFAGLAPGSYKIRVVPPPEAEKLRPERDRAGCRTVDLAQAEVKEDVELSFSMDAVTCTGRVTSTGGGPLGGARIRAVPLDVIPLQGEDGYDRILSESVEAVADDGGGYLLQGLAPVSIREVMEYLGGSTHLAEYGCTYVIRASADGYASAEIVVPALQTELVELGRALLDEWRNSPAYTDDAKERDAAAVPDAAIPVGPGNVLEHIDFALAPEARILGSVFDTRGEPVPGVRIRLVREGDAKEEPRAFDSDNAVPDWTDVDEKGAFEIAAVPEGRYDFEVDAGAGAQRARNQSLSVRSSDRIEDVRVIVEAAADRGRIEGVVVGTDTGLPVGAFDLRVVAVDAPVEPSPRLGKVKTDADSGHFTIEDLSAGQVTLEVKASGYATEEVHAEIASGQTTTLRVTLDKEGVLRGHVSRNGQPSAYGSVTFPEWEDGPYAHVGEHGNFEIGALPAGRYLVKCYMWLYEDDRGGAQAVVHRLVDIEAGGVTEVDIRHDGHGVVQGAFVGIPDTTWHVSLHDPTLPEGQDLRAGTWKFQHNGRYEIPDTPPGTYELVAACKNADGSETTQSETISVAEGAVVEVDFTFP